MFRFVDKLEAGIIHVNSPTVGGEAHIPFGGMKATGVGLREMGRVAIDFYTELKVVYVDYTGTQTSWQPVLSPVATISATNRCHCSFATAG